MKSRSEKFDIYQLITDKIIAKLEAGVVPWHKTWACRGFAGSPRNLVTGKPYRGVNFWLLQSDYEAPFWLTFNQCKALGGQVRKGEKSTTVVFWSIIKQKDKKTGDETKRFFLRYYNVFNVSQCDSLPQAKIDKLKVKCGIVKDESAPSFNPIEAAEHVINDYVASTKRPDFIRYGGDRACYSPALDDIKLPRKEDFNSPEAFYATAFHEAIHSTGHATRLNRDGIVKFDKFGSDNYSKEELVAELGAAYLCGVTGIEQPILDSTASYLDNWIRVLKGDNKLVISASSQAQAASDYVLGDSREASIEDNEETENEPETVAA